MAKAFKFRHANEIAGSFVLGGLALLVVAVVLVLDPRGWFVRTRQFTVGLPESGSMGLKPGADVLILGNVVGSVREIRLDDDGQMRAAVSVRTDFSRFIKNDSRAVVKNKLGIGDASIEISRGKGPMLAEGVTIPYDENKGRAATDLAEDLITDVRAQIIPTLKEANQAMAEYRMLAADLRDPDGGLQRSLASIRSVAENTEKGEGLAGKLLVDPEVARNGAAAIAKAGASVDEFHAVLTELHKTTATLFEQTQEALKQTQTILADLHKTTAILPDTTKSINRTAEAMPGLILQIQETMRQTQRLVEGIQRSFLVRGSVAPDSALGGTIRPENVGSGGR